MLCYVGQFNLQKPAGGNSGLGPTCVATPVGFFNKDILMLKKSYKQNAAHMKSKRFGKWLVLERAGITKFNRAIWLCRCDCGVTKEVVGRTLRNGESKSCGCNKNIKHGMSRNDNPHPLYKTWNAMIQRCTNLNVSNYKNYGGRGITVCDRWLDVCNFIADMGSKPTRNHSLDRIDNNQGYSPENCKWATETEQTRNRRSNKMLTYKGKTQCLSDFAKEIGVKMSVLSARLKAGWSIERALVK